MSDIKYIDGGVCSAKGFKAAGTVAGFRKNKTKKDLCLIVSDCMCSAAAVYTTNKVKGAPIAVTKAHIADGKAQAVICNSGNANTCAPGGVEVAEETCRLAAKALDLKPEDIAVCSTGVIGEKLKLEPFENGIPVLAQALSYDGSDDAAAAIMTTDTIPKSVAVEFTIDGKKCTIGGIAKGSGMINPNMATMLSFITSDVNISPAMLQKALSSDIKTSFNQICVDGDTSTNDTVLLLANGQAGNPKITEKNADYEEFKKALNYVNTTLAKKIAGDGEGATALFEVKVIGAATKAEAVTLSKSVVTSSLTKAAIYGHDANWGRILCALGYSGVQFDPEKVDLYFESKAGKIMIIENGVSTGYSEEEATKILSEEAVTAIADMKMGDASATAWGCDLTYDYIKINADYRS